MHFRFIIVPIVIIPFSSSYADENFWNCEKGLNGEWVCESGDENQGGMQTTRPTNKTGSLSNENAKNDASPAEPVPMVAQIVEKQPVYHKPPAMQERQPGWSCRVGEEDTWNCSLVGADPKGQARVVGNEGAERGWFSPTYDFNQEEIFKTLQAQLPYDPWMNCNAPSRRLPAMPGNDARENAPMDVHADYTEVFDEEVTTFYGNVDITRADQRIQADMASYDSVAETMDAQGHVFYTENALSLYSDSINLKLKTNEARLRNALFISPAGPIRGAADVVYRDNSSLSRYKEASFTSCRPGNQDWLIHASRLKMNKQTGKGAAKHAWLEFKGVPVLYTPYISFPIDNRRLSGFLTPTFGSNTKNGLDIEVPYYWNIAPNYDATVAVRYMGRRGGMFKTGFRYLTEWTRGNINVEFLPYDRLRNKPRYGAGFKAQSVFTPNLKSNVDLNYVSDKDYFNDLNNSLGFSNTRQLRSHADIRYSRDWLSFVAQLENYQVIDRSITDSRKPYNKLPQVQLNLKHAFDEFPLELAMENEYTYFYRSTRISGHRFNAKPSISVPWQTDAGYIKPKVSLQYSEYFLSNQSPGQKDTISRVVPIMSIDSGLFFEKELNFAGSSYLHTLEPRAFYLYIPYKDQRNIPTFDTSLYDLNFYSLFRENRFNGPDRIQDANQVTLAMTSRLIDSETGAERLKLNVGEIFYFRDREVVLPGRAPETNSLSNLIAELSGQLTSHWSFSSGVQWNPDRNDFTRAQGTIRYRDLPGKIINLGYRYRRDNPDIAASIIQSDVSFRWPLYDNWFAVGRWQYSLKFSKTVESFVGLEKESCCWRFRIIGRRFINNISNSVQAKPDNAIFVQLELKGLTSFGDKVDQFLEKNLPGYRRPEN